jgi:hypothetical protein
MSIECSSCEGQKKEACDSAYRRVALRLAGAVDVVIDLHEFKGIDPVSPVRERELTLGSLEFLVRKNDCGLAQDEIQEKLDLELTKV